MKKIILEGNDKKINKLRKELQLKLKRNKITLKDFVESKKSEQKKVEPKKVESKKIENKIEETKEVKKPVKRNYKRKK